MDTYQRGRALVWGCASLLLAAGLGCRQTALFTDDLPYYPKAKALGSSQWQFDTHRLTVNRRLTNASVEEVKGFYAQNLASRGAWTVEVRGEETLWQDGNMHVTHGDPRNFEAQPLDTFKPGRLIRITEEGPGIIVEAWVALPLGRDGKRLAPKR